MAPADIAATGEEISGAAVMGKITGGSVVVMRRGGVPLLVPAAAADRTIGGLITTSCAERRPCSRRVFSIAKATLGVLLTRAVDRADASENVSAATRTEDIVDASAATDNP